jgi:hypothetical protein
MDVGWLAAPTEVAVTAGSAAGRSEWPAFAGPSSSLAWAASAGVTVAGVATHSAGQRAHRSRREAPIAASGIS